MVGVWVWEGLCETLLDRHQGIVLYFASLFVPHSFLWPFLVIKECQMKPFSLGKRAFIFFFPIGIVMSQYRFSPLTMARGKR